MSLSFSWSRRSGFTTAIAGLIGMLLVGVLGACSSAGNSSVSSAASTGSRSGAGTTSTSPATPASPTGTASRPADPIVTATPTVTRAGAVPPAARVIAAKQPFTVPVSYPDGITLKIVSMKQGTATGVGPGAFVGAPVTQFDVELVNTSERDLVLDQVVTTLLYGSPSRLASPVYQDGAVDLAGTIAKGATVKATYLFSIPTAQLGRVSMTVDFDGKHGAATFEGAVR